MENDQSFWQFSDKLRLQSTGGGGVNEFSGNRWAAFNPTHFSNNFSNLSMNDNSIWSTGSYDRKKENLESRINQEPKGKNTEMMMMNNVNMGWKFSAGMSSNGGGGKNSVQGGRMNENPKVNKQNNSNGNGKNAKGGNSVDKRFKTLPPSESLPHGVPLGGYIFVCNNDTMEDDLRRLLFGLPQRYRDSVRAITPGLPLFLYNYSTHQLHGIFQAASFGGTNIDPTAWEDKKCPGESRFPAQVRVETRKACPPLEEDSFRPVLHHYDGPKFRLQLSIPEALSLLDIFEEKSKLATPPLYVS